MALITPIAHLNGTALESLITQRTEAIHALDDAYTVLRQMQPHGRDYYHTENYDGARAQFMALESRLQEIIDEIRTDTLKLCEQRKD